MMHAAKRAALTALLFCLLWVGGQVTTDAQTTAPVDDWAIRYPRQYALWQESIHGSEYLAGNTDVPGCLDCHPDPGTGEQNTATFRLSIPARCAECHADAARMSKYDIDTDAYSTYVADLHGTTVEYYRSQESSEWRYEAVCSDCHESHAIYPANDAKSSVSRRNIVATCARCHHGSNVNFTKSVPGHYRTNAKAPVLVRVFGIIYKIFIPTVLGGMLAYIGLDIYHRVRTRRDKKGGSA